MVQPLAQEESREEGMATLSSIPSWRITRNINREPVRKERLHRTETRLRVPKLLGIYMFHLFIF